MIHGNPFLVPEPLQPVRFKVRLTTTSYQTARGVASKKELYFFRNPNPERLKDCFLEDMDHDRSIEELIINLGECKDGVYQLSICNECRDSDGYVDDWDWRLDPWED